MWAAPEGLTRCIVPCEGLLNMVPAYRRRCWMQRSEATHGETMGCRRRRISFTRTAPSRYSCLIVAENVLNC